MSTPNSKSRQRNAVQSKSDVEWIGDSTMEDGKNHYSKCLIRGVPVNINDYVMVNTGKDSIGQVLNLHYLGNFPDPYRVKLHWLYRYSDLTDKCVSSNDLKERTNELFIPAHDPDNKPFNHSIQVIDAETIVDVCKVEFLEKKDKFPLQCPDGRFYVQYAFDSKDRIYSAMEYMEIRENALKANVVKNKNNKCRTLRLSSSEKQWRVGTPKNLYQSDSPFSLKPYRITLKASAVEKQSAKKPSKRKASKSIPDQGEVKSKKSKVKTERKERENTPGDKTISKTLLSPLNTYRADEVRNMVWTDDADDDQYDNESTDQSDDEVSEDGVFTDECPIKQSGTKRKTRLRSKATAIATPQNTSQCNKENRKSTLRSTSKSLPKNHYQTPKSTTLARSATGKPTPYSVKSSRKVSIKTPSRKNSVDSDILAGGTTPKKTPGRVGKAVGTTPKKTPGRVGKAGRRSLATGMTPSMPCRSEPCKTPRTPLQEARSRLHVSAVPPSLPCRDDEYADILGFVEGKLIDGTGGCMYISGVPGTGKTATVHEAIRLLQESVDEDIPQFRFIEINGMKLTEPNQAYSMLLKKLTGQKATPAHSSDLLEKLFTAPNTKKESLVLMVDELDLLWTRKQGVMYNLFEWPSRRHSKLIVLAIANTMDLPERMMINRVQSRLGLTRLTFQPYTHSQLQEIVLSRIKSLNVFDPDAMQLVARKVAAVSGDARRCLDICRRAVEITELAGNKSSAKKGKLVGMAEVNTALQDMFSSPKIKLMMNLSSYEILLMRAVLAEFKRTGVEETTFGDVFEEMCNHCRLEGVSTTSMTEASAIVSRLGASRLLLVETGRLDLQRRISLNVNQDDVIYALRNHSMK